MKKALLYWILSALAVWIVSQIVPGFTVDGAMSALIAAVVIGLISCTLGTVLKLVTFPFAILTLGLFWLVINALMLMLASYLLPGLPGGWFHLGLYRQYRAQPCQHGHARDCGLMYGT
jgi:putative membrane protein